MLNNSIYKRIWTRRRLWKRIIIVFIVFPISLHFLFIFYNPNYEMLQLTAAHRCPVCYGMNICSQLYSKEVIVDERPWHELLFKNVKNVYRGHTNTNKKVLLKKLATDRELRKFDNSVCKKFDMPSNCKPGDLLNYTSIYKKIVDKVCYKRTVKEIHQQRPTGFIFCPYPEGVYDFLEPILGGRRDNESLLLNIWTMLNLNAEPLVLQMLPKSKGWHVPEYIGLCGRLEVVSNEGTTIADLGEITWLRRLNIAKQILSIALDFTYKHDRYRFYFFDWIDDNIVVNEKDEVSFIDFEDVIVLDKNQDFPNCYMFAQSPICERYLSDHNVYSACHLLLGDENPHPFLNPLPKDYHQGFFLTYLFQQCLYGSDKFTVAETLIKYMTQLVDEEEYQNH